MRTLTALAAATLLSFAPAQAQLTPEFILLAAGLTRNFEIRSIECPKTMTAPTICFRHHYGVRRSAMSWDDLVSRYADLAWLTNWYLGDDYVWRILVFNIERIPTSGPMIDVGIALMPIDDNLYSVAYLIDLRGLVGDDLQRVKDDLERVRSPE